MSLGIILDCSMAMSWCFPDEASPPSIEIQVRLESEPGIVPAHWFLEIANVLAFAEKKKRITIAKTSEFLSLLDGLELEVDNESTGRAFSHILAACRSHGLTSYDAAYLDLASRKRLPLASVDDDLRAAARKAGIQVLGK